MKVRLELLAAFIFLLLCGGAIISLTRAQEEISPREEGERVGDFFCPWLFQGGSGRGPFYYAWLVNGTLMEIGLSQYSRFFKDCGIRIYSYTHWSALPKHPLLINDPALMFAQLKQGENSLESDMFMIINGTKWPIIGRMNQTLSSGVKAEQIVYASP